MIEAAVARVAVAGGMPDAVQAADVVLKAAPGKMPLKQAIFAKVEAHAPKTCFRASNTEQGAAIVLPRQWFENMVHPLHDTGGGIVLRRDNDPPDRCLILLAFGWAKAVGGMARTVCRGLERVRSCFILAMTAKNLARSPRLLAA